MGLEKVLNDIENKGRREGMELAKQTMAKQLLAKQMDTAFIAEVTGFSPEVIKRLGQENN